MFCKNCGTEISNDSKFCHSCGTNQQISLTEKDIEVSQKVKFEDTLYQLKILIDSKDTKGILNLLNKTVDSKENGEIVLNNYSHLINRDLIEDLKNLSNSYDTIKSYVQRFIDFELIEPKYPHSWKNKDKEVEQIVDWKEEALNPKNQKNKFPLVAIIIGVVVVIFIYKLMIPSNNLASKSQQASSETPKQARIGDQISVGNFIYQVNKVEYKKTLGNQFVSHTADGIYIVIDLSLKNQDNEEHTLDNAFFKLEDINGNTYESSTDGTTALEMSGVGTLFLKQCNPNITKQGYLVFEVPSKGNYVLHLSGGFWSGETAIVELVN